MSSIAIADEKDISALVRKLPHLGDLALPFYATIGSAGMDLLAAIEKDLVLRPHEMKIIPTGISIAIPYGYEAQIRPRSGIALKHCVTVLNAPGTIDSDYRGEICVMLINHGNAQFVVQRGDRIAQMIIAKYVRTNWDIVEELPASARGSGGLGSTGK